MSTRPDKLQLTYYIFMLIAALQMSGCVRCQQATFYKYVESKNQSFVQTDFQHPNFVKVDLDSKAMFDVGICGGAGYVLHPDVENYICVSILVNDGVVAQLQQPVILFEHSTGEKSVIPVKEITYLISCKTDGDKHRICTSSESSPVRGASPTHTKSNAAVGAEFLDVYHFSANLSFIGAADTIAQGSWFGRRMTGRREYNLNLDQIKLNGVKQVSIRLPDVYLDGKSYSVPALTFKLVTEDLCHYISVD